MQNSQAALEDLEHRQKIEEKEAAAHEKRQWVRLTSYCNNRCTFCLDSSAHNGTYVPRLHIRSQIIEGRRNGATRLILSGGEPTIHPNYVEFIKLGKQLGYEKIQTVTNGRLFAYDKFLNACLDAGLDEITFSIHGHNAKVHDALVGVQGAFDEEVEGLKKAMTDGRPIINIDVCLNKGNIRGLPELLNKFIDIGVREYDLLHIIPFGRAYEEGRNSLFYDIHEAMPSIQHALKVAEDPGMHIWFNRFPPPYLEGYEHLIQDPYKLNDEVRGRKEEYDRWIEHGTPLSCRDDHRCSKCYMEHLCNTLEDRVTHVADDSFDALRIHPTKVGQAIPSSPGTFDALWIDAANLEIAADTASKAEDRGLILDLRDYSGLAEALAAGGALEGRTIQRAYADSAESLALLLGVDASFEVVAWINQSTTAYLQAEHPEAPARLVLAGRTYERLTEAADFDPDFGAFFKAYDPKVPVEELPECITGRAPQPSKAVLDADMLDKDGKLEIFGFAKRYILDHYYTKSHRCTGCAVFEQCQGAHINHVRAHGYKTLQPIEASEAK